MKQIKQARGFEKRTARLEVLLHRRILKAERHKKFYNAAKRDIREISKIVLRRKEIVRAVNAAIDQKKEKEGGK